ncbi:MAG: hypothetical protein U0746_02815 [Gemmataceae bacterium]
MFNGLVRLFVDSGMAHKVGHVIGRKIGECFVGNPFHSRIDALCSACGWSVDGRSGKCVQLNFNDNKCGIQRTVVIDDGGNGTALFMVPSAASFTGNSVPAMRKLLAAAHPEPAEWCEDKNRSGETFFYVRIILNLAELTPELFGKVCEQLVVSVSAFDSFCLERGLI